MTIHLQCKIVAEKDLYIITGKVAPKSDPKLHFRIWTRIKEASFFKYERKKHALDENLNTTPTLDHSPAFIDGRIFAETGIIPSHIMHSGSTASKQKANDFIAGFNTINNQTLESFHFAIGISTTSYAQSRCTGAYIIPPQIKLPPVGVDYAPEYFETDKFFPQKLMPLNQVLNENNGPFIFFGSKILTTILVHDLLKTEQNENTQPLPIYGVAHFHYKPESDAWIRV